MGDRRQTSELEFPGLINSSRAGGKCKSVVTSFVVA